MGVIYMHGRRITITKIVCLIFLIQRVCGQCDVATRPLTLNAMSEPQYVTSPDYDGGNTNYPSNSDCAWVIHAPGSDERIIINVQDAVFDSGDTLTIYDGDSTDAMQLATGTLAVGGMSDTMNEYVSTSSALYLKFTSDLSFNSDGFNILYFSADAAVQQQCSETLNATLQVQYRMSANLPDTYTSDYSCTSYVHAVDQYYTLKFKLYFLDVEDSGAACANDKFEISTGNNVNELMVLQTLCTRAQDYQFTDINTVSSFASITLQTDSANTNYYGFLLSYQEVFQGITLTYPSENDTVQITVAEDLVTGTIGDPAAYIEVTTTGTDGLQFTILENGNISTLFALTAGPTTYNLETTGTLDYETTTVYNITILIVDAVYPGLSATARFNITLTDVNDNSPVFTNLPTTQSLYRTRTAGYKVFTVSATDADITPRFQTIPVFVITAGDTYNLLTIDGTTGVITLAQDASTLPATNDITLTLTITANSKGVVVPATGTLTLSIPLDSPPECTHEIAWAQDLSTYDDGAGTVLEFDEPWNCTDDKTNIIYAIGSVSPTLNSSLFTINSATGQVTLLRTFTESEVPLRLFNVTIQATDSFPQTTTFTVSANVTAMTCLPNPMQIYVRTDAGIGSVIISDYNCSSNSSLQYTITSQAPAGTFGVSGSSLVLLSGVYKIKYYSLAMEISNGLDTVSLAFQVTVRLKQCSVIPNGSDVTSVSAFAVCLVFLVVFLYGW